MRERYRGARRTPANAETISGRVRPAVIIACVITRQVALLLPLASLCAGCSGLPGLDAPQVELIPKLAILRVKGDAAMQSTTTGGAVRSNARIGLSELGVDDRDEDVGGTIAMGDGFSGFEIDYQRLDQKSSRTGTLGAAFGAIEAGDVVQTKVFMDEFRLRYTAGIVDWEPVDGARLRAGPAVALTHREIEFQTIEQTLARAQTLEIKDDGVAYIGARARLDVGPLGFQIDWGVSPDWTFGGDFRGTMHDLEATVAYRFADHDVTAFGGYRRSELEAEGYRDDRRFDADLLIDGYVFGLRLSF